MAHIKFTQFLYIGQLVQSVVDGSQRNVRHTLLHQPMDLLGRGVVCVPCRIGVRDASYRQDLKDGPPLGSHLVAMLFEFLNEFFKS
jgi:hypothetical protein